MSAKKYRATLCAFLLAALTVGLFELFEIDSLILLSQILEKVEHLGMDLFVVPSFLIAVGVFVDTIIAKRTNAHEAKEKEIARQAEIDELSREAELRELSRQAEIQEQRLRVMQATMRTVHHIVNNSLNHLQLFRLDAENLVEEASLKQFDGVIQGLAADLTSLANLSETPEKESCIGVMLDCEAIRTIV